MKVRSLKRLKLKLQDKILFGSLQIPWNSNVPHFECLNTFSESQVGNAIVRSQQKKQTWQRLLLKKTYCQRDLACACLFCGMETASDL